jgi:hypothetical protein
VDKFKNSERRIIIDHTNNDIDYIRRYEFEKLIEFWEIENPQLILLSQRRKNHREAEIQTVLINIEESEVQTEK